MKISPHDLLVIATHSAYNLLLAAGLFILVAGVLLMFRSKTVFHWNERLDVWISTRNMLRVLEQPRHVHEHLYRRHRIAGALLCAAAVYGLYMLLFRYQAEPILHAYRDVLPAVAMGWIVESLHILLSVGSALVLAAGVLLILAPDRLRALENWSDRHFSARQLTKPVETMNYRADSYIRANPGKVGAFVTLSGAYVLVSLVFFWKL